MLGFIGGNGVAATNKLLQLIEERFVENGAIRDSHHPEMLIWQATQAPSRSMFIEGRGPSFIDDYVRIGTMLKSCGCTELCIGCNTAHYAIDEISSRVELPFINIIDEVVKKVFFEGYRKVAIMCTDGCRKTKLYERSFLKYAPNVEIFYPSEIDQRNVTLGICNAKNSNRNKDLSSMYNPYNIFSMVVKNLENMMGNEPDCCVIAGCTDIRNVFFKKNINGNCGYIDSLEVLADYIYNKYKI